MYRGKCRLAKAVMRVGVTFEADAALLAGITVIHEAWPRATSNISVNRPLLLHHATLFGFCWWSQASLNCLGEANLFYDILATDGQAKCLDRILSCEQDGVLSAIHPVLKARAQAIMLKE